MTLRKITIDNSVRYVKKSEQTIEKKPNMIKNIKQSEQIQSISKGGILNSRKNISVLRKQNNNTSQNNKKFIKSYIYSSRFPIPK